MVTLRHLVLEIRLRAGRHADRRTTCHMPRCHRINQFIRNLAPKDILKVCSSVQNSTVIGNVADCYERAAASACFCAQLSCLHCQVLVGYLVLFHTN